MYIYCCEMSTLSEKKVRRHQDRGWWGYRGDRLYILLQDYRKKEREALQIQKSKKRITCGCKLSITFLHAPHFNYQSPLLPAFLFFFFLTPIIWEISFHTDSQATGNFQSSGKLKINTPPNSPNTILFFNLVFMPPNSLT